MKHVRLTTIFLLLISPLYTAAEISATRQNELIYLLKQDCGSCHGLTLKGGLGPALLPDNLKGKFPALLTTTILTGRKDTAMPAWEGLLSHDDAAWLTKLLLKGVN